VHNEPARHELNLTLSVLGGGTPGLVVWVQVTCERPPSYPVASVFLAREVFFSSRMGGRLLCIDSFVLVLVPSCPLSRPRKLATHPGRAQHLGSVSSGFTLLRFVLLVPPRSLRASRCAYFGKTRRSLCTGLRGGSPTGGRCFAIGHSPNRGSRFVAVDPSPPRGNARVKLAWEARSSGVTPARRSSARETRRAGGTP
jgi:hypothetical protein